MLGRQMKKQAKKGRKTKRERARGSRHITFLEIIEDITRKAGTPALHIPVAVAPQQTGPAIPKLKKKKKK